MTTAKPAPQLKQFGNFWTLTGQPPGKKEWSIAEKVRRAKAAGFPAMGGHALTKYSDAVHAAGMDYICYIDANEQNYRERLKAAAATVN